MKKLESLCTPVFASEAICRIRHRPTPSQSIPSPTDPEPNYSVVSDLRNIRRMSEFSVKFRIVGRIQIDRYTMQKKKSKSILICKKRVNRKKIVKTWNVYSLIIYSLFIQQEIEWIQKIQWSHWMHWNYWPIEKHLDIKFSLKITHI